MRLHRFYTNQEIGAQKEIKIESSDLVHQVHSVFRLKSGDELIIFDGSGSDFVCRIADFDKKSITLDIESAEKSKYMPSREVILYASIVKKDNFEWIVEKATELGVTKIVPVISERSEKKALNMERLKKIAVEASEQSGRGNVPIIDDIKEIEDVLGVNNSIVFHIESAINAKDYLKDLDVDKSLSVFIGPEGGWSDGEIELFRTNNMSIVTLGNQVLRAETAVIASLSLVLL